MSEKFTASNGVVISTGAGSQRGGAGFSHSNTLGTLVGGLSKLQLDAFREFFLHERDQELGRWRDPVADDYYVVNTDEGQTVVVNERTSRWNPITRGLVENYPDTIPAHEVGARYFTSHPLPKSWHDAKPGELWEVSVSPASPDGIPAREPLPMQVMLDNSGPHETRFFVHWNGPDVETIDVEDRHIESAKRLWPEAVES